MMNLLTKKLTAKQTFLSLFVLFLLVAGYFIVSATINGINNRLIDSKVVKPETQTVHGHIDPGLDEYITELNIDSKDLNFIYVDSLPEPGANADFTSPNTIRIKRNLPAGENAKTLVAHEYLHYVWSNYPQQQRNMLSGELETLYSSDTPMQNRMKYYIEDHNLTVGSEDFSNELHSIYCTESSDSVLTKSILEECNRWIYRPALTFVR